MSHFQICDISMFRSHDCVFFEVFLAKDRYRKHPTKKVGTSQKHGCFHTNRKGSTLASYVGLGQTKTLSIAYVCLLCLSSFSEQLSVNP